MVSGGREGAIIIYKATDGWMVERTFDSSPWLISRWVIHGHITSTFNPFQLLFFMKEQLKEQLLGKK